MTRVAYFMTEFPRKTDTFVQREITSLRELGAEIQTISLRRPDDDLMVGPEQVHHREQTSYLLDGGASSLLRALLGQIRQPGRTRSGLAMALRLRQPGLRGSLYQLFYTAEALLLAEALRQGRHSHVHAHYGDVSSTISLIGARFAGVRSSFTLHGPGVFFEADRWHLGDKVDESDFVSCISWFCRSQAQLLGRSESADHLHIVHCGVDPARYPDDPERAAPSDVDFRVCFVGRLDHVKGVSLLIDAVAELKEAGLRVGADLVGDGPDRTRLERSVAQSGLSEQITFHGALSQQEVAEILTQVQAFVLPSFAEGVPVVLMEAQAASLPVIASQVGGITELVSHRETGLVIAPGHMDQLVEAIRELAHDPQLRHRLGRAGRARVEGDFTSVTEAARLLYLFERSGSSETSEIRPSGIPVARGD